MFRPAGLMRAFAAPARRVLVPTSSVIPAPFLLASRTFASANQSQIEATSTSTSSPPPPPPPPNPLPTSSFQTAVQSESQQSLPKPQPTKPAARNVPPLPFFVDRTPSGHLPVYHLTKRSGTKKLTVIKKISGDSAALRDMLARDLGLVSSGMEEVSKKHRKRKKQAQEAVVLNSLTKHVYVQVGFPAFPFLEGHVG